MDALTGSEDIENDKQEQDQPLEERVIPISLNNQSGVSTPDEGKSTYRQVIKQSLPVELPIIPDANTLKRRLHNLFISGPSLRARQHDSSSVGSAASMSPTSTESPSEWSGTEESHMGSYNSEASHGYPRISGRDLSIEEELAERVEHISDVAKMWHIKWRQEREDVQRLSEHIAKCEYESKRLLESLTIAYGRKVKMMEDLVMKARLNTELVLQQKNEVEECLRQSRDVIEKQRIEIEKEFTRARDDVNLLRSEMVGMQQSLQRLEKENEDLRSEKSVLSDDLKVFTNSMKSFNSSIKEADISCDLYKLLFDIAFNKLKSLEGSIGPVSEKFGRLWGKGRYRVHVDEENPTIMHFENVNVHKESTIQTNTSDQKCHGLCNAELKKHGKINVTDVVAPEISYKVHSNPQTSHRMGNVVGSSALDKNSVGNCNSSHKEVSSKVNKRSHSIFSNKDGSKRNKTVSETTNSGSKKSQKWKGKDKENHQTNQLKDSNGELHVDVSEWLPIDHDGDDLGYEDQLTRPIEYRLRSLSDSEEVEILEGQCGAVAEVVQVPQHSGSHFLGMEQPQVRQRSQTMDGRIERTGDICQSGSSSTEDLKRGFMARIATVTSATESLRGMASVVRRNKAKDFTGLLRAIVSDKDSSGGGSKKGSFKRKVKK